MQYIDVLFTPKQYIMVMFIMFLLFLILFFLLIYFPPAYLKQPKKFTHGTDHKGGNITTSEPLETINPKIVQRVIKDFSKVGFFFPPNVIDHCHTLETETDVYNTLEFYLQHKKLP